MRFHRGEKVCGLAYKTSLYGGAEGDRTPDLKTASLMAEVFTLFDLVLQTHISQAISTSSGDYLFDSLPCELIKIDVQC